MKGMPVVGLFAVVVAGVTLGSEPKRHVVALHRVAEQVRLRAHFDSVLDELRARDVSRLTTDQRVAREELTTWLAEYRDAGEFPLNDRFSDSRTPIFRDAHGVACAMAYLIERSGRGDIVDRVERAKNLAHISELAEDPALTAWLDSVGLGLGEASRVQPSYAPRPDEIVDKSYARSSLLWSGASVATTTWNIARPGNGAGMLGVFVGLVTVFYSGIGSELSSNERHDKGIDTINRVTGASAIVAGLWAFTRKDKPTKAVSRSRIEVAPIIGVPFGSQHFTLGLTARY